MEIVPKNCSRPAGSRLFQYLAMIFCTLNIICSGMHYGWSSPALPQLLNQTTSPIPITDSQGSWIAVMPLIGSLLGGLLGGLVLNFVGRKKAIIFLSLPYIASWLMLALANSVELLFTARFLAGISDGLGFCVIPMYLGEIADPRIRGVIGSSVAVASVFGIVLINILGSLLSISNAALVSLVFPITCMVACFFLPESPYFLTLIGDYKGARESMVKFKGEEDVQDDLERIKGAIEQQRQSKRRVVDLFVVRSNRKAMIIAMGLRTSQQLCGITAITFYAQVIFEQANSVMAADLAAILYFLVQLVCGCVCSLIVDKTGRKPLLIVSIVGTGASLFVEGIYFYLQELTSVDTTDFSSVPIIGLVCCIIMFSVGMQSIPILMLGELFPTGVKAYAISFNDIYFCVVAAASSKFFQFTKDTYGLHLPFFVFAGCSFAALAFIIYVVPETKRKTLEDIQAELRGEKREEASSIKLQDLSSRDVAEKLLSNGKA